MGSLGIEVERRREAIWSYPRVSGFKPSERWGQSACLFEGVVYFFGGCRGGLHYSDVLTLHLNTMAWSSLHTTSQSPGTRDSHSAALVGHKMIIFGGTSGSRKVNDLHILDLKTKEWTKPNCKGIPPSPRESHTATVVGEDKLVIFGGSGEGEPNYLNDIHILDLMSLTWTSPVVNGVQPVARDSHTAVAIGNKLLVYGGDCGDRYYGEVDVLDMETMTWLQWMVQEASPGARAGHAAVAIGTKIYIIGGVGDKQYFSDVWMLDIVKCTWKLLDIHGKKPRGRFSHTAVATRAEIVIYGGCGEDERPLDELLVLQLGSRQSFGPPNVSMCKIFGNCLSQDNGKAFRGSAELNKRIVYEYSALNQRSEEAELETRRCFAQDNSQSKRKKIGTAKVSEMESEQEEHSLSLSQHSSPSISEEEQNMIYKSVDSSLPTKQFIHFNLQNSREELNFTQRTTDVGNFTNGESSQKSKSKQFIRCVAPEKQEVQFTSSDKSFLSTTMLPPLVGADVHGTVDGAFDSGYLITAQVNGQILRGVLFPPRAGLTVCRPQVHYESSPLGSPGIAFQQYPTTASNAITIPVAPRQPSNFVVSECGHYLHQAHSIQVPRELPRSINDLLGVDLTLGGPRVSELHN